MKEFAFLFFALLTINSEAKVSVAVDFGTLGNTQTISEQSIKEQFSLSLQDFNATEKKNQFVESLSKIGDANLGLQNCDRNITRTFSPGITLSKDYFSPDGRIYAKAGQRINPLLKVPYGAIKSKIVVMNGDSNKHIEYARFLCPKGTPCTIFLNSGNVDYVQNAIGLFASPLPKTFAKTIDAKCAMSVIEAKGTVFEIHEINLEKPKNGK